MVQIVLEGGRSDLQRHELDGDEPPAHWLARDERYEAVLDHWDQRMRDINGRWRHRLKVEYRATPRGYEAPRVKP